MTPLLPEFRDQLHGAAQRRIDRRTARILTAPFGRRPRALAASLPALLLALLAVAIAVLALAVLRHAHAATPAASTGSRQQLIDTIGVLRRPQTQADLNQAVISAAGREMSGRVVDRSLVRYATTTPWGEKLYFVPFKPARVREPVAVSGRQPQMRVVHIPETLALAEITVGVDLASIERGQLGANLRAGQQIQGGGTTNARFVYVVPDGVAKVTFVLPRDVVRGEPFQPVYASVLRVSVPVHNNVVAVQVNREYELSEPPMIWYSASGALIKRIGDFQHLNRVVPEPMPGPETARSRAAEKDPSTPNPVWITPATGTQDTPFAFHFQVLLNEAAYQTRLSGPACAARYLYRDHGAYSTSADGLRGHIFNGTVSTGEAVDPYGQPNTQWCPGTYRFSIKLISEAFDHPFEPAAKPFGTATFTVKP